MKRNERAKTVAYQNGFCNASGIKQGDDALRCLLHRRRRFAPASAVTWQVHSQHVPAMVGKVTRLQNPNAVIVEYAMDEHGCGLGGIKKFATRINIKWRTLYVVNHAAPPL